MTPGIYCRNPASLSRSGRRDGSFLINGALGLDYVTITYLRDTRLETTRAAQEAILARLM